MRIAHIITRMIVGGAQENTLLTCLDLMREYGDEVLLVSGPEVGPEGSLLERVHVEKIPLKIIPTMRRSIGPWNDWRAYRHLAQTLREFKPDVVHTHSAKAGVLGRKAAWKLRVPAIVHTVHGAPYHPYQGRGAQTLIRTAERFAARRCHALVSVADAMTDLLVRDNIAPREKFTTIYSGMETEPFLNADIHRAAMRAKLGFGERDFVFGKVARLFHLKGHAELIEAAREVVKRDARIKFLFVGDGLLRESLQNQIAQAGLTDHFKFAGLVRPEEIPAYLAAMDVVVHTSLREGLARVLPQALMAGKPVISYDIDGAREVVRDGLNGRLIPPRNVASLSQAMAELAGESRSGMVSSVEARRQLADQFHHRTMTRQLRQLYERLLP